MRPAGSLPSSRPARRQRGRAVMLRLIGERGSPEEISWKRGGGITPGKLFSYFFVNVITILLVWQGAASPAARADDLHDYCDRTVHEPKSVWLQDLHT